MTWERQGEECSTSAAAAAAIRKSNSISVLLVEGDDSTRHIISALLRKCSYSVSAVPDGFKAWELLKDRPHTIDAVLSEVDVPSISGISLLSLITDHDACKHIPVIMMSSHDSINMVFNCMLKGAADFLVKPVRKNELSILWQHVWRRHTKSDMEGESAYKQNSHNSGDTFANGKIQPNMPLMDHKSKDEGKSANEQLLEEESANEDVKTMGSICDKSATNDMGEETYDRVSPPIQIIDFIGAIDNQGQFGEGIRENTAIDNNHGAPEVIFPDEDSSCKPSYAPFLELSLRRYDYSGVDNEETTERSTLNHSCSSAFSLYNRTPVPPLATTGNLQAECGEYYSPATRHIPDKCLGDSRNVHTCNGRAQHINAEEAESESPNLGVSNPNGIAIRCSPIRAIPMHIPVGGMQFDRSAGYHTLTEPNFYREHEPILMIASNQSEANAFEHQNEKSEIRDEPWHAATTTGDDESSRICHGGSSGQIESNDAGRIFNEGNGNIGTKNISSVTPEFQNQEDKKPEEPEGMHRSSQRDAALNKFRLKRKERCFEKKVRYQSRKRLAEQRPRVKGQFVRHIQPDAMDCQVEQAVG